MSLASQLRKAAYAVPLVFALAASNANAAPQKTLEVDQLDLSKPVPTNTCFESNAKGTAFSKLTEVMNKRNQIVVAAANQVIEASAGSSPQRGEVFTSSVDGKEGYDIGFNVPKEQMQSSSSLCLMTIKDINIYDVYKLQTVPSEVDKGEMGIALRNSHKNGLKVMMTARSQGGALIVLQYNPKRGGGALLSADANGNSAGDLSYMVSMGYSKKAKEILGIQDVQTVALAPQ